MATYDETKGGTNGFSAAAMGHSHLMVARMDAAEANDGNGLSADDSVQVINLPANHMVLGVRAAVIEAEGDTLTFDVGDSGSDTRWHDGLDGNDESTEAIDDTITSGTSDDDIRITVKDAASNAVIEVTALVVNMNPNG